MDYEKKYKEITGKIKKAYLYAQANSTKAVLEEILPELKESEGERIRKGLIENFKWFRSNQPDTAKWGKDDGLFVKDIIAWLEKQGEQKWSEKDEQHIDSLLKRLEGLCRNEFERTRFAINEDSDWLESLKERY